MQQIICNWLTEIINVYYDQGPVVRTRVSANPRLNFNPGFFFFLPKALSRIIFSIFFLAYPTNCRQREFNWICFLNSDIWVQNFAVTLGYLNPASNNPAQGNKT